MIHRTLYKLITCRTFIPITPPPFPSQPGITALHTGHLATFSPIPTILTLLCNVVLTAVNRHAPQHTCPQGVSVALLGGKKHIGQVYSDRGSASEPLGSTVMRTGLGEGAGLALPFPLSLLGSRGEISMISGSRDGEARLRFDGIVPGSMFVSLMIFIRLGLLTGLAGVSRRTWGGFDWVVKSLVVALLGPGLEGDNDNDKSNSIDSRIGEIAVGGGGVADCRCVEVME